MAQSSSKSPTEGREQFQSPGYCSAAHQLADETIMRSQRLLQSCALTLLGLVMSGCAADKRPKYMLPNLAADQVATLTGGWGYYVEEVDGARIDVGGLMSSFGGNITTVTAGEHHLRV